MTVALPKRCFISHSYQDSAASERLRRSLPRGTSPVVFPPIRAKPDEFVSKPLIDAVVACDGLIYLRGGASDRSFWVAFERDYALRAGKRVFYYDIETSELAADPGSALDLAVFADYAWQDHKDVADICKFLGEQRCFDVWLDDKDIAAGADWKKEIEAGLADRLNRGGYLIAFWSEASCGKDHEEQIASVCAAAGVDRFNDRVLLALLDRCPIPDFWLRYQELCVQIYGDAERPRTHRIDDLMVRLYWLIYRKTHSAQL